MVREMQMLIKRFGTDKDNGSEIARCGDLAEHGVEIAGSMRSVLLRVNIIV